MNKKLESDRNISGMKLDMNNIINKKTLEKEGLIKEFKSYREKRKTQISDIKYEIRSL